MSRLTKSELASMPAEDFLFPDFRGGYLGDYADAVAAQSRANFASDPTAARLRVIAICQRKGIRLPGALAAMAIAQMANEASEVSEGQPATPASNVLRFDVRTEQDLDRACDAARARLKGEVMSTNFDRHNTPAGQSALQQVHDLVARYGAICKKPANLSAGAEFISKHESSKLQSVHDLATEGGAQCNSPGSYFSAPTLTPSDPRELARQHAMKRNRQIAGASQRQSAELSGEPMATDDPRESARAAVRRRVARRNEQIVRAREQSQQKGAPFLQTHND